MYEKRVERNMQNVDETINAICDWIKTTLGENDPEYYQLAEMTKALAVLIVARGADKVLGGDPDGEARGKNAESHNQTGGV